MKKFVQIASTINIDVAPDLRSINATNPTAPMVDKLTVKPGWVKFIIPVKVGMGWYPAEIKDWNSVKDLARDGIFTIGAEADTCPNQEEVEALCKKIQNAKSRFESEKKSILGDKAKTVSSTVDNMIKNVGISNN